MTYHIIPTVHFNKDIEYYVKKKRFLNIDKDMKSVINELENGNLIGDAISEITSGT